MAAEYDAEWQDTLRLVAHNHPTLTKLLYVGEKFPPILSPLQPLSITTTAQVCASKIDWLQLAEWSTLFYSS